MGQLANALVTNSQLGAAIQDSATFVANPANHFSDEANFTKPYAVGRIGDIVIYVDPRMRFGDTRVIIGELEFKVNIGDNFLI
jgi:hypothetical protein